MSIVSIRLTGDSKVAIEAAIERLNTALVERIMHAPVLQSDGWHSYGLLRVQTEADVRRRRELARLLRTGRSPAAASPAILRMMGLLAQIRATEAHASREAPVQNEKEMRSESGTCRSCGCTDDRACPGGCMWVDASHTLCSACVSDISVPIKLVWDLVENTCLSAMTIPLDQAERLSEAFDHSESGESLLEADRWTITGVKRQGRPSHATQARAFLKFRRELERLSEEDR